METVTFTRYPRSGKKLFKTGVFKQKPMSVTEADEKIKQFASQLGQNQTEDIALILTFDADDSEEARDYQIETVIDSSDADEGLMGVVRRDTENEDLTEEEREDIDDLDKELQDQLMEDEEENFEDNNDFASDLEVSNPSQKNLDNSVMQATPTPETDQLVEEVPVDNSGNNMFVPDFTPSQIDVSEPETTPEAPVPPVRAAPSGVPKEETKVKSSGEYEDASDILNKLPEKYDADQFDLDNIKLQLGYKMQPEDRFDKELNRVIDKTIKDQGLDKIKGDYDVTLASLKNGVIDNLTSEYNRINQDTVDNAVEINLAEKINQLDDAAIKEKAENEANAQEAIQNEQEKTDVETKAKLADYKVMLESKAKESMHEFMQGQNDKLLQLNDRVDKQLSIDKEVARKREKAKVVNERNVALVDARTKIANAFLQGVQDHYLKANDDFSTKIDTLVLKVQEAQEELDQKREEYERRQAELAAKNQANELKKRELDQKQEELNMTRKQVEALPDAIAQAVEKAQAKQAATQPAFSYAQIPVAGATTQQVPIQAGAISSEEMQRLISEMQQLQKDNADIKNTLILNKKDEEIASVKKELATTKKHHKRWTIGLVTFLGVAALSSVMLFGYQQKQAQSAKQPTIVLQTKSKAAEPQKKNGDLKSTKKVVSQKTPFEKYQDLKNWSEKRDFLNGLLGQHDSRNLEMIVKEDPTNLAKLYLAISNNNDSQIREAWNKMTPQEQSEATAGARNTVAIAFYNVKDWEKGYEARYAR